MLDKMFMINSRVSAKVQKLNEGNKVNEINVQKLFDNKEKEGVTDENVKTF